MSNPIIEDDKEAKKILIGTLLAFIIASIMGFTQYEYDFLIGKIGYAICIGIIWALSIGGILTGCNKEYRQKASVSDKIILLAAILYPLLFGLGWKLTKDIFLETHPLIHAYAALMIPAIILGVV